MAEQVIDENIAKVFGDEWTTKYHESIAGKRAPRLKFENEVEEKEFLAFAKQALRPETPKAEYKKGVGTYDIMIVQTPQEIRVNPMKFGASVAFRYGGDWISAIMQEEEIETLVPDNAYLIAGIYSEKKGQNDRVFKNFRIHYLKSFAELAEQVEQPQQQ